MKRLNIGWILLGLLWTGQAHAQVILQLWHSYRAEERCALEKTLTQFNTNHADIRVDSLFVTYDAYMDKLNLAIPRGNGPDLFIGPHDRVGDWAESGLISPVDEYLSPGTLARFFKKTVDPLSYKGKTFGLPTSFKSAALFYNKALVAEPPQDTQKMIQLALAARAKKTADGQEIYGLVWDHSDLYFHAGWLFGFQGKLFNSRDELTLDARENIESVEFVRQLVLSQKLAPLDISSIKVTSLWNSGRAAMVVSGPWFRGEIDPGVRYGVAILPTVTSTGVRAQPFVGTEAFLISAHSTYRRQAYLAMEWLTRDEMARIRLLQGNQPVANIEPYQSPEARNDPALAAFKEQLKYSVPMPNTPEMRMVWGPMKQALTSAIGGLSSPQQALSEAQRRTQLAIDAFKSGQALKGREGGKGILHVPAQVLRWTLAAILSAFLALVILKRRAVAPLLAEVNKGRKAYAYLAPALIALGVLILAPLTVGIALGFFKHVHGEYFFVGLQNYADILSSKEYPLSDPFNFYYKLGVTLLWTAANVIIHVTVGLGLALLLKNPLLKCKSVYRVLLIIPWAVPNYITAIVWRGMFDADDGVINHLLGIPGFSWWNSGPSAFLANLITNCWLGFPFMMVVALGALQSIPRELYEAASADGAGRFQQFRHITLPLLKPAMFPAIVLGVIMTFNMFNVIYLVSRGAPNGATDILVIEAFRWAFERGERYGYAAAYATLIFLILLLYTVMTNRISQAAKGAYQR